MNQEQIFLANAYFDGELADDERAIAEADPVVMAEVEQLRALQAELRSVEPPSAEARESAIAAAMAEFQATPTPAAAPAHTGAAPPPRSNVVSFFRRPIARTLLGAAAAVVAIAALGTVISRTGNDDSELASEPAEEPADEPVEEATIAAAADDDTAGDVAESFDDEPAVEMASEPVEELAEDAADEPADEPAEEPAAEPADEPASDDAGAEQPVLDPTTARLVAEAIAGGQPFSTPPELAAYAVYLLDLEEEGALPPTPEHSCELPGRVLDRAVYQVDDLTFDVLISIDADTGFVQAIDEETCLVATDAVYER